MNRDETFFARNIFGGAGCVRGDGRSDFVRADIRADAVFGLRARSRALTAKSLGNVARRRAPDKNNVADVSVNRRADGLLAGGGRYRRDNLLHGGLFHPRDNFAHVVLAVRAGFGFDGHGFRHGRDDGRNLRGDG